jgi:hypothetical protein
VASAYVFVVLVGAVFAVDAADNAMPAPLLTYTDASGHHTACYRDVAACGNPMLTSLMQSLPTGHQVEKPALATMAAAPPSLELAEFVVSVPSEPPRTLLS